MAKLLSSLLVLALVGAAVANFADIIKQDGDVILKQFVDFMSKHGKNYGNGDEFSARYQTFKDNLKKIEWMNLMDPDAEYRVNEHADLSEEEFARIYLGADIPRHLKDLPVANELPTNDIPASFDWRDKGAVTDVKNQGQCGSCWSFSTTGNIEGVNFVKTGKLVSLSEQFLVDCDKVDQGCGGGLPTNAYKFIIDQKGIPTEESYPYTAKDGQCKSGWKAAATISSFQQISQDEQQIAAALVANGPLSIGINAGWMQFYFGGVSNPWFCSPTKLDHGVLIVGYGTDNGKDFWTIKNSWGPSWGEKGYYRIIRGKGKCGLNTFVTTAQA